MDHSAAELSPSTEISTNVDPAAVLTATEARIAALVTRGATNREIAAQIFVSVKTVEANLTRIYRKLGVRSRSQLSARLSDN